MFCSPYFTIPHLSSFSYHAAQSLEQSAHFINVCGWFACFRLRSATCILCKHAIWGTVEGTCEGCIFRRGGKGELRWTSTCALDVGFPRPEWTSGGHSGPGLGSQGRRACGAKDLGGASGRDRGFWAGPGRGERAQTRRAGSAGGPAVSLQLREAMGRFAAALVGSLFGLGLLLYGLGSLASAEPRAPPDKIGRCRGYGGTALPRLVFPRLGGDRGP